MTKQTLFSIMAGENALPADVSVMWAGGTLLTGVRIEPGESLVLEIVPAVTPTTSTSAKPESHDSAGMSTPAQEQAATTSEASPSRPSTRDEGYP